MNELVELGFVVIETQGDHPMQPFKDFAYCISHSAGMGPC